MNKINYVLIYNNPLRFFCINPLDYFEVHLNFLLFLKINLVKVDVDVLKITFDCVRTTIFSLPHHGFLTSFFVKHEKFFFVLLLLDLKKCQFISNLFSPASN